MLIHERPMRVPPGGYVRLPRRDRAPLGLADGCPVWVLYQKRKRGDGLPDARELLISPFNFECWSDIWRLDIQLRDVPGNLKSIIEHLDQHNIRILHSTSRYAFKLEYYFNYIYLDCTRYVSEVDGDRKRRSKKELGLLGLETELSLSFLDKIRLSSLGDRRIRVERNEVHLNMYEFCTRLAIEPKRLHVSKKDIRISDVPGLESLCDEEKVYAVISTNTKSHLIYCTLANEEDIKSVYDHVVIIFDNQRGVIAGILTIIEQAHFNIVRCQTRNGLFSPKKTYLEEEDFKKYLVGVEGACPATMNLFVERTKLGDRTTPITEIKSKLAAGVTVYGKKYRVWARQFEVDDYEEVK